MSPRRFVELKPVHYAQGWRSLKRRHRWRLVRDVATLALLISLLVLAAFVVNLWIGGK